MDKKFTIENQWTHQTGPIKKYTDHMWQVGFYEKDGITFAGIFNHVLWDDKHTTGLEEGGGFSDEVAEQIMLETVRVLSGHDYLIYGHLLLRGTNFLSRRPKNISLARWLISSRKKKFAMVVAEQTATDGVDLLAPPDSEWFITVKLGRRVDLLDKYFARIGRNPDQKPDVLYMASENIDAQFEDFAKKDFLKQMPFKSFSGLTTSDLQEWKKLIETFPGILWAADGHVYFVAKHSSKDDLLKKLQPIAEKFRLNIVSNHVLC